MSLVYQLLALDPAEKTRCENSISLLYLIRGFTKLWKTPKVHESDCKIIDGRTTLSITQIKDSGAPDEATNSELGRAYILTLTGEYSDVESLREPVTAFLKAQEFELLYVLKDQFSEHIACKLYPHLYRVIPNGEWFMSAEY